MRIAAFDMETTDLKAFMGTLLCGSFQSIVPPECEQPEPYTYHVEINKKKNIDPNPDKDLAIALRNEVEKYDTIVTWNGKMFDVPMLNARLLFHNERPIRTRWHVDMMYYAGYSSNRIGSKKLDNVQKFMKLGEAKTPLDWEVWKMAMRGSSEAMLKVIDHCQQDVKVLTQAYWRLLPYVRNWARG